MKWKAATLAAIVVLISGEAGWAQPAGEETGPSGPQRDGWHLFSMSAYTGYMSLALPNADFNYLSGAVPLGADIQGGGAVSVGWNRLRPRSSISLNYDPSYSGMIRHSEWSALNHALAFHANRKAGNKWEIGFSTAGTINSLNQFLFTPTVLSNVAGVSSSFDELASGVLAGKFTNDQLASILTGAPVLESPSRTALYGDRVLSASISSSLSYAYSSRLSFHLGGTGSHSQALNDGQGTEAGTSRAVVLRTTGGNANVGLSYALNPATDFGLEGSGGRTKSSFQDAYTTNISASLGRKIGRRWFLQGGGGPSWITPLLQTYQLPQGLQYTAHGSIGYRTPSQSFMATVDRIPADMFGTGAGYTFSSGGAWKWHPRGSPWDLSASVRQQRMRGTYQELDGWIGTFGVTKRLNPHTAMQITYSYMNNSGMFLGASRDIAVHAVQFAIVWRERAQR